MNRAIRLSLLLLVSLSLGSVVLADTASTAGVRTMPAGIVSDTSTKFVADLEYARYSSTVVELGAAFIAVNQVIPFTAMSITPSKVGNIRVCADGGSATNYAYVSWGRTLNGHGATAAAWTGAEKISGLAGCRPCAEYPFLANATNSGTLTVGAEIANGISAVRITVGEKLK